VIGGCHNPHICSAGDKISLKKPDSFGDFWPGNKRQKKVDSRENFEVSS